MTIKIYKNDNGSYEWVEGTYTKDDFDQARAADDAVTWLEQHAEIIPRPS
jgi:hypothetical protein